MKIFHFDIKKKNCERVSYLKNGQICVPKIQDELNTVHFVYEITEAFISHLDYILSF